MSGVYVCVCVCFPCPSVSKPGERWRVSSPEGQHQEKTIVLLYSRYAEVYRFWLCGGCLCLTLPISLVLNIVRKVSAFRMVEP